MEYMPTKNLETFMKSRQDFTTEKDYQDYLRTYFAAMAMQGMLAEQYWTSPENLARCSTEAADALINALNDKP